MPFMKGQITIIAPAILILVLAGCDQRATDASPPGQEMTDAALIDNSLVGWWKFDEGRGDQAEDSSGHGHTARILNGDWSEGKKGAALLMDGGDDSIVTIPLTDQLRSTGEAVTVMGWAYRTAEHNVDIIGHGYPALFLGFHGPQFKWQVENARGKKANCYADPKYRAKLNQWFHLAGTYDGRTARLYVDGEQICSTWLWFSAPVSMPEVPFTISGYLHDSGEIMDEITGKIDDVRIYKRVLEPWEIGAVITHAQ